MKKANLMLLVATLGLVGATNSAFATNGTISVNGKVVTSTCTLTGSNGAANTTNVTVDLSTVANDIFTAPSSVAGSKDFTLTLKNGAGDVCDDVTIGGLKNVTLSGTAGTHYDATNKTWLINTDSTAPTAKDVYVQILNGTTAIDFSTPKQLGAPTAAGTYALKAQYISNTANPKPQTVKTSINYTLEYN